MLVKASGEWLTDIPSVSDTEKSKLLPTYKFFALRVTPPAHPGPALAPKWPKMAPSWHQIGSKNRPKMGYPIGLGGQKWGTPSPLGAKN